MRGESLPLRVGMDSDRKTPAELEATVDRIVAALDVPGEPGVSGVEAARGR